MTTFTHENHATNARAVRALEAGRALADRIKGEIGHAKREVDSLVISVDLVPGAYEVDVEGITGAEELGYYQKLFDEEAYPE